MEKPGISAYNKLKGPVMEFGYVTESGDKVRVRSMPADGLDPITIQKHLKYVEQEYVAEGLGSAFVYHNLAKFTRGRADASKGSDPQRSEVLGREADDLHAHASKELQGSKVVRAGKAVAGAAKTVVKKAGPTVFGSTRHPKTGETLTLGQLHPKAAPIVKAAGAIVPGAVSGAARAAHRAFTEPLGKKPKPVATNEDTTYTRREVRKLRLLEAIRKYGDTDA